MTIRQVVDGQSGLPVPNSTKSYWHKEPSEKLLGHRTTPELPETADIAIVGSGITGAFAAHFLKNGEARDSKIVMLEAREACWGATGRNGGHCQPFLYAAAPEVAAFELQTYRFIKSFIQENNIACDWVGFTGVHAFLTQELFDATAKAVEDLARDSPELASQISVVKPSDPGNASDDGSGETLSSLRIPDAKGAILQKNAASLWPYKLVSWVLERLLEEFPAPGFSLQTNTPVTGLRKETQAPGGSGGGTTWTLTTPRGRISAKTVLLCTNAYTSRLLPAFTDLIVPTRGQVAAILPPKASAKESPAKLEHSYVFLGEDPEPELSRDDYLIQRPLPTGELIFGGGRNRARNLASREWRDDVTEESVSRWLRGRLSPPLDLHPAGQGRVRAGLLQQGTGGVEGEDFLESSYEWTGIMGYSRDHHPFVGAVPESLGGGGEKGGLWISAGYTGHGMPVAALCARDVVQQIVRAGGDEREPSSTTTALPSQYQLTEERLRQANDSRYSGNEKLGFAAMFPQLSSTVQ